MAPARTIALAVLTTLWAATGCTDAERSPTAAESADLDAATGADLDAALEATLARHGFTGGSGNELEHRLGRALEPALVEAGRLLFFDPVLSLTGDNSCSGCHSPTASFGGTQSIAIGVQNNGIVGPDRAGPRNQRRSPTVANSALFPRTSDVNT
ncbi:MAG: cytochrome-c peroxidase [Gemmatimonadota bacterium]